MTVSVDYLAQMPNPFTAATVTDSDLCGAPLPDAEALQHETRQALRTALGTPADGVRGTGRVVLLVGEAGGGKSHLLNWLHGQGYLLLPVAPMPAPGEPFRHALRQVIGLLRQAGTGDSPLSRLLWHILYVQARDLIDSARSGLYEGSRDPPRLLLPLCEEEHLPRGAAAFAAAAGPQWARIAPELARYLASLPAELPLDQALRQVLVQYPQAERRELVVAWLSGEELGEADLGRLQVTQTLNSEAAARRVLLTLCRLAPVRPVLAYDQVEGLSERFKDAGLAALVELIVGVQREGGRTAQIVACTPPVADRLRPRLRPRLLELPAEIVLPRLRPEEVRELVLLRLRLAFAGGAPDPAYPFSEDEVREAAAGLQWPRQALRHFETAFDRRRAQLLRPPAPPAGAPAQSVPGPAPQPLDPMLTLPERVPPSQVSPVPPPVTDAWILEEAYQGARAHVRAHLDQTLPGGRAATLRAVFRELCDGLRQIEGGVQSIAVVSCDPLLGGGLRLIVQGGERPVRAALEVSNADVGPALFGAATRLARQVSDGRTDLALLLREEAVPLAGGMARGQSLEAQLGPRGALVWLSADETIELLAAERLLCAASAGELRNGPRTIGRAEALALLLIREAGPPRILVRLLQQLHAAAPDLPPLPSGRTTAALPTIASRPTQLGLGTISVPPGAASDPIARTSDQKARQTLVRLPQIKGDQKD